MILSDGWWRKEQGTPPARPSNHWRGLLRSFQGAQGLSTSFPGAQVLAALRRHRGLGVGSLEDRGSGAGGRVTSSG